MPLSIAYLAANLRQRGHQVSVLDSLGEGINHVGVSFDEAVSYRGLSDEEIVDRLPEHPDAIGITTMFSQEWLHVDRTIRAVARRFPGVPIIVGGEHATAAADFILESCPPVKMVALGEGEETILEIAAWLEGRKPVEGIGSIKFLQDGRVVSTPPQPRIRDIDDLPWPAWDLFNVEPYFETGYGYGVERGRAMPVVATRGCPYQCTFCSSPQMWTTRYVMRRIPLVVDEIEHYLKNYNVTNIDFLDLTLVVKRRWTLDYCAEIRRRGLKFTWQLPSGTRSEAMDEEVLEAMSRSGCTNVAYAPESGSERILADIKKKVKLPVMLESIRAAKRHGIFVRCNLILGFPTETRRDMWKTLWLAFRFAWNGVDDTTLHPFSPYPGSELFTYLQSTGRVRKMDREYFISLMGLLDLTKGARYCENVGPLEINFYRLLGLSIFYGMAYALRPWRILRSLRNFRAGRSDTSFEERVFGTIRRWRSEPRVHAPSLPREERALAGSCTPSGPAAGTARPPL